MNPFRLSQQTFSIATAMAVVFGCKVALAQGGGPAAGPGRGGVPNATPAPNFAPAQTTAITAMNQALATETAGETTARNAVTEAAYADPRNDSALNLKLDALKSAELTLANARAEQFLKLQASTNKLSANQITAFVASGGRGAGGGGGGRGGAGGGGNLDPGMAFIRPTSSPGLGQAVELPKPDAAGFIAMFNGKDLSGWDALTNFWSVKDGLIDCVETLDQGGNIQSDLTWLDSKEHPEKYANFEFHVSIRFLSHSGNSGVQIRSRMNNQATKHVAGYQADLDPANQYTGGLHDEDTLNGRHSSGVGGPHMGPRGYKTLYPADGGAAKTEPLAESAQTLVALIKPVGEFNDFIIIADGPHITINVNGHLFSDVTDEYPSSLKSGIIAFQQHMGFQEEVQFKDPKIKFLPAK